MNTLITTHEAAEIVGCSQRQIRNLIQNGAIKGQVYSPRVIFAEKKSCEKYGKNRPKRGRKPTIAK